MNRQLALLGISKGAYYYEKAPAKGDEARLRSAIDKEHLERPAKGVPPRACASERAFLCALGFAIGVVRALAASCAP